MFLRRHYYDNTTGETVYSYSIEGAIKSVRVEYEFETVLELAGRTPEDTGLLEWTEKNAEIEQNFVDSYGRVTVDVAQEPPALIFDFSPLPEPPAEESELEIAKEALTELGVDVNA